MIHDEVFKSIGTQKMSKINNVSVVKLSKINIVLDKII